MDLDIFDDILEEPTEKPGKIMLFPFTNKDLILIIDIMFAFDFFFFFNDFILCFVAQRGFGKFQPKTKNKKQSGLSQPPATIISTRSLVLDESSSGNKELKVQPQKTQKEVNYHTSYGFFELNVVSCISIIKLSNGIQMTILDVMCHHFTFYSTKELPKQLKISKSVRFSQSQV